MLARIVAKDRMTKMQTLFLLFGAAALSAAPALPRPEHAQLVPTRFEAGHFFAVPETVGGERLKLMVDTGGGGGGGMYWISRTAATRLKLDIHDCDLGDGKLTVADLPRYKPGKGLPSPLPGACGPVLQIHPGSQGDDGQLGAGYLPGRVWTFDYPAQRLTAEGSHWKPDPTAHATALGFPRDASGAPQTGMARMIIEIDGHPLDMLLDTGATAHPTVAGRKASGTPTVDGTGVTSYITTSVLEHWHAAHPDWPLVEDGDDAFGPHHPMRLIRVPQVHIADWSLGPVWFTERPDRNFHEFMARYMDKPTDGAVGGNVFGHFVMTIDYPGSTAYFRCVKGCRSTR